MAGLTGECRAKDEHRRASLSDGELYTVLSNKDKHGQKGALAAIVVGTRAEDVSKALDNIPENIRDVVQEMRIRHTGGT